MHGISKNNFPAIESAPNKFWTWFIRVAFSILIFLFVATFFIIPILFYIGEELYDRDAIVFLALYYPFIISMGYLIVRKVKRNKEKAVIKMVVNQTGIHYEQKNGNTDSILYTQLEKAPPLRVSDVFTESIGGRNRITVLKVMLKGREHIVRFDRIDVAYSYYSTNQRVLRSHFIHGIEIFRPDLSIDKMVYSSFHIDPETYAFDKNSYRKDIIIVTVLIFLIFLAAMSYVIFR